jgi:hypothetical protein
VLLSELRSEVRNRLAALAKLADEEMLLDSRSIYFPTAVRFVENQGWFTYLAYSIPLE